MTLKSISEDDLNKFISEEYDKRTKKCIKCGSTVSQKTGKKNIFICKESLCKFSYNVWEGTVFEGMKVEKIMILKVLFLWMNKASKDTIHIATGASLKSIWRILSLTKRLLVPKYYEFLEPIGGDNMIVEIDESKMGKRKYNRGHRVEGVWILGLVERTGLKRIRLYVLNNRKKEALNSIITGSVKRESFLRTDK